MVGYKRTQVVEGKIELDRVGGFGRGRGDSRFLHVESRFGFRARHTLRKIVEIYCIK